MYEIIENKTRNNLIEGRTRQMAFAFLKQITLHKYKAVMPLSPCKDYLNDVLWCEDGGEDKDIRIYGFSYKKHSIFKEDGKAYMAISIENDNGSLHPYSELEEHRKNLRKNYKKLQEFMNVFDRKLKVKYKTIIYPTSNKNIFLIRFDYSWCKSTYLISAYSLLMRLGQFWKGEGEPLEFIKNDNNIYQEDSYLRNDALPRIEKLLKAKDLKSNFKDLCGGHSVHNTGILCYKK